MKVFLIFIENEEKSSSSKNENGGMSVINQKYKSIKETEISGYKRNLDQIAIVCTKVKMGYYYPLIFLAIFFFVVTLVIQIKKRLFHINFRRF